MDDRLRRTKARAVRVNLTSTLFMVSLLVGLTSASIPYTPSHLLYAPNHNGSVAYLLRPSDSREDAVEFLSLNISGNVDTAEAHYTTLLDEAPFQTNNQTSTFIPVIDQHGVIKVYAGDCQNPAGSSTLWQFDPDTRSSTGNGTWESFAINETNGPNNTNGPNFLSVGFSYAPSNTSDSSVFAFGGMCPFPSSLGLGWTASANYSQSMVVLDPPGRGEGTSYQFSTTGDRAPPIPEAGFAVVPLQATYAHTSKGDLLQQQDFLLIGGHTQQAFLNMSQLAVFSLPQNSWSFLSVNPASEIDKTELAVRNPPIIEPRSGHSATMSPDGSKVIVFGGWVGNTNVPAEPQLAILELGADYTGYGKWSWKVQSMKDSGMAAGTGIYGHGATMLPGGMMMISGGYSISSPSSKRSIIGSQSNSQVYLYNVTSGSWSPSYANPDTRAYRETTDAPSVSKTASSMSSRKAGLGVGLGVGIPVAAGGIFFVWYYCRRRRVRSTRDKELRKLALSAERDHYWTQEDPNMASSIRKPQMQETGTNDDYPWSNNDRGFKRGPPQWHETGDSNAERVRLLMGNPSPTKGKHSVLNAKVYRPPAQFHEYRRGDATGDIHPIDEREEEDAESPEIRDQHDPFRDSACISPQSTYTGGDRYPAAPGIATVFAAGLGISDDGRSSSPEKDNRTSSNLSDSSSSAKSINQPRQYKSPSLQSSGRESPEKPSSSSSHGREIRNRPDSATLAQEKRYSSDSYSTAYTSLSQRQAEGEHLLIDGPEPSTPVEMFSKPLTLPRPRASEWIGNVRRVLSVTRRRPSTDQTFNTATVASGVDRQGSILIKKSSDSSYDSKLLPRRSVSAAAELFQRKQGARDWGAGNRVSRETNASSLLTARDDLALDGLVSFDDDDADWDVEGAAEGRRVQVTFTVPKEKLRVVNATAGDMDGLSVSSISRNNSDARDD
ncbi:hypothetical protein FE257_001114 [Aspergillus nanangensis]|uniref:Galactose oxidase n=1 Tax=Aspergillus nanangensis TaxID=2582783 RepID=A0AAD4CVY4_ASPNN|nr:hypothetical protein FE257_001114 [Aspergillus nanangensis]